MSEPNGGRQRITDVQASYGHGEVRHLDRLHDHALPYSDVDPDPSEGETLVRAAVKRIKEWEFSRGATL